MLCFQLEVEKDNAITKISVVENILNLHKKNMDIQAEKIELLKLILETENISVLTKIRNFLTVNKKSDFWDSLSENQKEEIFTGIEEIEKKEIIGYDEFMSEHR